MSESRLPAIFPRLELRGISKAYGATQALSGVDLTVAPGEVVALLGENGAGKSTLMKVLSGACRADAGSMLVDGQAFAPADPLAARARGIAIVHQELSLCDHLSVAENISLGAWPGRWGTLDRRQMNEVARWALERLGADIPLQARCGDLPPAARQVTEIARSIAAAPLVLVLDEPTSSLGSHDIERLFTAIRRLQATGVAVIIISHVIEECRAVASRFAVLRDGASVAAGALAGISDAALIEAMVGRPLTELYPRTPHTVGTEGTDAVLDIAPGVTLHRGEILGIYGLIGAGRTELLHRLFTPPRARLADGIGLVSEDRKGQGLLLGRSIADNLTLTKLAPYVTAGWLSTARQAAATRVWIAKLGVRCQGPAQAIGELSGGNQQKIALGRLLHHGARILLLDEPTRGIDVGAKAQIYRQMGELAAEGSALLVVSSYLPELLGTCDTLTVMCRGQLPPARPVARWTREAVLSAAIGADLR